MLFTPVIHQLPRCRSCSTSSLSPTDFEQTDSAHKKHAVSTTTTTAIIIIIITTIIIIIIITKCFSWDTALRVP